VGAGAGADITADWSLSAGSSDFVITGESLPEKADI
jgi:hypothetical protein